MNHVNLLFVRMILIGGLLSCVSTSLHAQWKQCSGSFVGEITCFTGNIAVLYVGTSTSGIYRSTDGGAGWSQVNQGLTDQKVHSLAMIGSIVFAGTDFDGLFRSQDNGDTWTAANEGRIHLLNIDVHSMVTRENLLFAGSLGGGVSRSSDLAENWTPVNTTLGNEYVHSLGLLGSTLFAGTEGGVSRSKNNGVSWEKANTGLPNTPTYVTSFTVSGTTIFAGTSDSGIFRSNDNGDTWEEANGGLPTKNITSMAAIGSTIFAGSSGAGVFMSSDNGNNWATFTTGLQHLNISSLYAKGSTLYAGTALASVWKYEKITSVGESESTAKEIVITPNPAGTSFTITGIDGANHLELINSIGMTIRTWNIESNVYTLDVAGVPTGVYSLRISTATGMRHTPVVVMH